MMIALLLIFVISVGGVAIPCSTVGLLRVEIQPTYPSWKGWIQVPGRPLCQRSSRVRWRVLMSNSHVVDSVGARSYRSVDEPVTRCLSDKTAVVEPARRRTRQVEFEETLIPVMVAILPAHNEERALPAAVYALRAQSCPPDRIIVASDNSTDDTVAVARSLGVEVRETVDNAEKKAGALNQIFDDLLPTLKDEDVVLVQDADSVLDRHFIEVAAKYLAWGYGGVGGVFRGAEGGGFVGHLQRNEYARYARDVRRLNGKCLVITGTAAVFRVKTLREVSDARLCGKLPAGNGVGGIYDTTTLTEDNELTFALLHLGCKVISPSQCTLLTEVMTSWRSLWKQRLRWKRGAIENCFQYGLTAITWRYWGRQLATFIGVVVSGAYLCSIAWALLVSGMHVHVFWLWVTLVFVVERVVTVRYRGWRQMILAATMYELILDYFLQVCHLKAYSDALLRRTNNW